MLLLLGECVCVCVLLPVSPPAASVSSRLCDAPAGTRQRDELTLAANLSARVSVSSVSGGRLGSFHTTKLCKCVRHVADHQPVKGRDP